MNISFNMGYNDGVNSTTFLNPIHNNWERDVNGFIHYNAAYLKGYLAGWLDTTGETL